MDGLGALMNSLDDQVCYYRQNLNGAVMSGDLTAAEAEQEANNYWKLLCFEYNIDDDEQDDYAKHCLKMF